MPSSVYVFDGATQSWRARGRADIPIEQPEVSWDWGDANLPWAYESPEDWESRMPAGITVVELQGGSSDFYTNLVATVNVTSATDVVVRLPAGVFEIDQFRVYSNLLYAFGFYLPKLRGFTGAGPDKTFVQMKKNSLSQAQLDAMKLLDPADFAPLQLGMMRFNGSSAHTGFLGGITVRADDQQMLTSVHPNLASSYAGPPVITPQPAPFQGVIFYSGSNSVMSHVRFVAAGRAMNSRPPFECGQVGTQYGNHRWYNCEFDGRLDAAFNPARPRRAAVFLMNNETSHHLIDSWIHHSALSRYATNDENRDTSGDYRVIRVKSEHITDTRNTDPALNGGNSLGGWTDASNFGYESTNGTITWEDVYASVDNPNPSSGTGQIPCHLQLTKVGSRNPQGGTAHIYGGIFKNIFPQLDGYLTARIAMSSYWWIDGFENTMFVYNDDAERKTPYVVTGAWPPSAATLAGMSPATHFLVRSTS